MHIVSIRDFRANQRKYFDMAEKEPVYIRRRGARPISISVVDEEELLSKMDLESIKRGLDDVNAGRTYALGSDESLESLLDRI